jgi:hypothetical protein
MRFLSREEKSYAWYQKRDYLNFFRLQIYVLPKMRNFKLCKSGEINITAPGEIYQLTDMASFL